MSNTVKRASGVSVAAAAALSVLGCGQVDDLLCDNGNCGWSETETTRIAALADLPESPGLDPSNKYVGNPAAEELGRQFFWETRFSGTSQVADALARPMPYGRTAKGQPLNISCASCHDLKHGGADTASVPGHVSIGAIWTDTNTISVINSAFKNVIMWAGRLDSLWAQAVGSIENSMGYNRVRTAWTIATYYRQAYDAVFTEYPLPMTGTISDVAPTLEATGARAGQCVLNPGCPSSCRQVQDSTGATGCWPRFPLDGKPGKKTGCQPGDATEPFGDAYDCMAEEDRLAIVRINVNFAKAVAAFEFRLVSRNSAFDKFVGDMRRGEANSSAAMSAEAKNGAKLFVGKAGCSDCHNGALLSDQKFHNIGIAQTGMAIPTLVDCPKGGVCDCETPNNCIPYGAYDGAAKLHKNAYLRTSMWSDDPDDQSRKPYMDMPQDSIPKGSYLTPSLRDVALTAPYMHDGAYRTLEEVVAHYNRGGDSAGVGPLSVRIKPLYLSADEQRDLVEFLKALTGEALPAELSDPPVLP